MLSIEEINLLVAQNKGLKEQNEQLQQAAKEGERYKKVVDEIYLIIDEIKEQYDLLDISELEQIQDIINKAKDGE